MQEMRRRLEVERVSPVLCPVQCVHIHSCSSLSAQSRGLWLEMRDWGLKPGKWGPGDGILKAEVQFHNEKLDDSEPSKQLDVGRSGPAYVEGDQGGIQSGNLGDHKAPNYFDIWCFMIIH